MSRNLHQFYYKVYFKDISWHDPKTAAVQIKRNNKVLTSTGLLQRMQFSDEKQPRPYMQSFNLELLYPGLVTGIGINHEAQIEGEFKLGVHFDWTYGMPVIYGSSVKGVLRSYFMDLYDGDLDAGDLMMSIFSGVYNRDIDAEKKKYGNDWGEVVKYPEKRIYKDHLSIYNRDIFFDAVIVEADNKGRILCSDSITPHGGETHDNPLKNPVPITFLKIAPGCKLEFRFKLVDTKIGDKVLKAEEKLKIFKEILTTVGIGAKTNVGYGQLK